MNLHSFDQLVHETRQHGTERFVLPVSKRLSADLLTPVSAFLTLRAPNAYTFLLESVEGGENLARYSFLGKNPYRIVKAYGDTVDVEHLDEAHSAPAPEGNIFMVLQHYLDAYAEVPVPGLPRLRSGAVGYLSYDAVRLVEHLPDMPPDDLNLPDAIWCFYDTVVAFDHVKHQLILIANAFIDPDSDVEAAYYRTQSKLAALEEELSHTDFPHPTPVRLSEEGMTSNTKRSDYEAAVRKGKDYIYEGDIFQVVLSQRFTMGFEGDQFNLYRALRQVNPSPYLFYLDFVDFAVVGSSPEVLVRVENNRAEILPIAGTRPRGATPEEDASLEQDLLGDPKERAEHLMLVDLGRNDLGRVCQFNTVQVDHYAYIERYSHVMHIVSSVSGLLDEKRGAMDVLAAAFPAGTLSGAPKVRAMEIIDELEPTKRGIYGGAVGHVGFSGSLDTCIAIRTMVVKHNRIYVQAGAGIVADSDPATEFEETENKARALKQAMLLASEGLL